MKPWRLAFDHPRALRVLALPLCLVAWLWLAQRPGEALAADPESFEPVVDLLQPSGPIRCPIIYYHEVYGPAGLNAQLAAILRAGYRPVTMGRLVAALQRRADPPANCLVVSFDDGLLSQIANGLPVLQRLGVPATFFVMPGGFQDGVHRYMNAEDFRALRDAGFELGSHTLNHASLPALLRFNLGAFQAEVVASKQLLERELGQTVSLFAYPNGSFNPATADEVGAAGYSAAAATLRGVWQRYEDRFWLHRLSATTSEPPASLLERLRG